MAAIGQGTYGFGGYFKREPGHEKELIDCLRYGFSQGMNLVDTAEVYGYGLSEEIVGKAIAGQTRASVFVATKVWRNHLSYDNVVSSCRKSLERMKLSSVDLYQIHWPDDSTPISETMHAFEKLVDDGLVSNIGVSNFSVKQLKEAMVCLSKHKIVSNQVHYSLDHRGIESELLPFCEKNGISVIAYSPLGTGDLLSGSKSKILAEVAEKYGKSKAQVALNWLVMKGAIPIPKSTNKAHVLENSRATEFILSDEDVSALEAG